MSDGSFCVSAMRCKSWSCDYCRRINAAILLERVRSGISKRPDHQTFLLTLTIDPAQYDGEISGHGYYAASSYIGSSIQFPGLDDLSRDELKSQGIRRTNHYQQPNLEQFESAAAQMSKNWSRLRRALTNRLNRRGHKMHYMRVIELHRNGWPHYHILVQLPSDCSPRHLYEVVSSWNLGRTNVKAVSADDAVSHVSPYLVNKETGRGKTYQFAADSLPKHFRLWTASKHFLGPGLDVQQAAQKVVSEHALSQQVADDYLASVTPIQTVHDRRHVTHVLHQFRTQYAPGAPVTWALHDSSINPSKFRLSHEHASQWFAELPYFRKLELESVPTPTDRTQLSNADLILDYLDRFPTGEFADDGFFSQQPSRDWSHMIPT